jgi:tRNA threonylcarbamoyladenosine biosynthesis protein TsaE
MTLSILQNEKAQLDFGARLARACDHKSCIIFLQGDLGAGKTTLVRGFLKQKGFQGKVKSPTYTLVETYEINHQEILHIDLYRIENPQEIFNLGIFEVSSEGKIYLIEWPERAMTELPIPDITCSITILEKGRACQMIAHSPRGEKVLNKMENVSAD